MHTNDDALSTPSHARAGDDRRRGPLLLPPFPFNLRALRKDLGPPSQEAIIQEIGPLIRRIEALTGDFKRLKQQLELTKDSEWVEYWSNRKEELSSEIKSIELEIKELEDSRSKLEAQPRPAMSSPRAGQRRKARDRALKLQLEFSNERLKQLHAEASQCRAIFRKSAKLIAPTALGAATKGPDDSDVEEDVTCFQGCMAKLRDVWARVNKCGQKQQQQQQQRSENVFKKKRSAFIQFYSQASAHMAAQLLLHSQPFSMDPKMLEVKYEDIIWANLDIWSWSRNLRFCVSLGITLVLSISWMSMTMTVTSLVSLDSISKVLGGSTGDEFKHQKLVSLVQGVLPSLLTSLLMKVLPEILRALLKFEGRVLQSDIELSLMRRYYYFLIINIFFSAVISSSFLDFIKQWDGNAWKRLLSTLIPSAYVYFITYILIQGWTGSAKEILQIKLLIVRYIKPWLSSDTPRSREEALKTSGFEWSVDIPSHTLIFLIGMTYSVFAPIV
ncbi:phosphate metabolism protein 7, partial [Spiromyces aspiralis]